MIFPALKFLTDIMVLLIDHKHQSHMPNWLSNSFDYEPVKFMSVYLLLRLFIIIFTKCLGLL